ncbi:MAG: prepilin peptidase [Firmicutes bacterium]|nr:prepilin peptidase [Bacillota bacterium]
MSKKIFCLLLGTAILTGVVCILNYGISFRLLEYIFVTVFTFLFSIEDIKEKKVKTLALLAMLLIGVVTEVFTFNAYAYISSFAGGILSFLIMLVMYFVTMRKLGMGDVYLVGIIGFYLGFTDTMQLVFVTLFLTVIYGIIAVLAKKSTMKTQLPMIPFMLVALFLNNTMILMSRR